MSDRLELALSYARLFETPDGQVVLKDFFRRMGATDDLYSERSGDTANDVIFRSGRLSAVRYIQRMMNPENIEKMKQETK